jgi:excisionase family DNA binding protein
MLLEKPLTKKETAEYLRCSERTLDRYRAVGILRAVKLRGKVLFKQESVMSLLKKHTEN